MNYTNMQRQEGSLGSLPANINSMVVPPMLASRTPIPGPHWGYQHPSSTTRMAHPDLILPPPTLQANNLVYPSLHSLHAQQQPQLGQTIQLQAPLVGATHVWQIEDDVPLRRKVIAKIVSMLHHRKPDAPLEWIRRLPDMARRLEDSLYRTASSRDEYGNFNTLMDRLQRLAVTTNSKTQAPVHAISALFGGDMMHINASVQDGQQDDPVEGEEQPSKDAGVVSPLAASTSSAMLAFPTVAVAKSTVIKVLHQDEVHRTRIDLTTRFAIEDLASIFEATFHLSLSSYTIHYIDDEGDRVTINSTRDVDEALAFFFPPTKGTDRWDGSTKVDQIPRFIATPLATSPSTNEDDDDAIDATTTEGGEDRDADDDTDDALDVTRSTKHVELWAVDVEEQHAPRCVDDNVDAATIATQVETTKETNQSVSGAMWWPAQVESILDMMPHLNAEMVESMLEATQGDVQAVLNQMLDF
ncbi:Aste57867_10369 [Aphanomyces stellatus]|uniref:Aste57867_10369 protein n=1 Tax=Aphanomyces stellatus TaxID=120398 RepID=A0A485KQN8_9STRA|nr:hypothetical protein As57867_010329 [Aphanomyces stellatus]VFT87243.1 Aste57867_10369 [Aphanomyces stellatus]